MKDKFGKKYLILLFLLVFTITTVGGCLEDGSIINKFPKYPGSEEWKDIGSGMIPVSEEMEYNGYIIDDRSVEEVFSWYKDEIKAWELVRKTSPMNLGNQTISQLFYKKENTIVAIQILSEPNYSGTRYILITGPSSVFELDSNESIGFPDIKN